MDYYKLNLDINGNVEYEIQLMNLTETPNLLI